MSAAADSDSPAPAPEPSSAPGATSPDSAVSARPLFEERLLPGVGGWIVEVVVGLTIAVALIPLSLVLAIVVGAVAALLGCTLAYVSSPVLRITGTHFSLGRARIEVELLGEDRKSTRLNSSHVAISYAVLCLKKKEIGGAKV